MHIAIKANAEQRDEFLLKNIPEGIQLSWFESEWPQADLYFDLSFDETNVQGNILKMGGLVFANAVAVTCKVLPANYVRINAWKGFLKRDIIEIACADSNKEGAASILSKLGWGYQAAPDEPGMIAARIISMIINEAYFAFGEEVSTKAEIDVAMRLGTNYPFGPFEWSEKIGLEKVYFLLTKLNETSSRYAIAPKLEEEIFDLSKMVNT